MLQKFALAFKSKAAEFFAEEDDGHARGGVPFGGLDPVGAEEDITGLRVVKPGSKDPPASSPTTPLPAHHHKQQLQRALVSSLFVTVSSFHAAYLHLQAAHEPFRLDGIKDADRAAVSHLQRLSDLRRGYCDGAASCGLPLPSHLEAEVLENQSTLRKFETCFNQLQLEVDQKDAEASNLKQQLSGIEACNLHMERKLGTLSTSAAVDEGEKLLLSVGVFDTVLKEACKAAHRFTKTLIDLLKTSGWDLETMAKSIYPGVEFMKKGHLGYALLSYICLGMFSGFGTGGFESGDGCAPSADDLEQSRREFLRQFVEQCLDDPIDLLNANPDGDFGRFCERKHQRLIHPEMESSINLGQLHCRDTALGLWYPTSPLYEPFVGMCSLVWMLHKLAMAFDRPVEIFQVQQGADFSMVHMENVVRRRAMWALDARRKTRPKVGFTVVPGFRLGEVVIQCRVYVNYYR
ncbi:hypothetical protein Taro_051958 [Colocasia esculenta]|uniref:DUF641 domain-containing protein n=1 Tax=Colocasia esculenta TaxID=4460 RepID=A0A843XHD6_COLES|nr:hypothetical protein [Colocasia esculenta]